MRGPDNTRRRPFTRRRLAAILLPLSAALACVGDEPSAPVPTAQLRLVNALSDAPALDIFVEGGLAIGGVPFRTASAYLTVPAGSPRVSLRATGTSGLLVDQSTPVSAGRAYTACALGLYRGITHPLLVLEHDAARPAGGRSALRFLHASVYHGNVDVYVTAPDEDITMLSPTLSNVLFGTKMDPLDLATGTYRVRMMPTTGKLASIDTTVVLADGQRHTVVAVDGTPDATLQFRLIFLTDQL